MVPKAAYGKGSKGCGTVDCDGTRWPAHRFVCAVVLGDPAEVLPLGAANPVSNSIEGSPLTPRCEQATGIGYSGDSGWLSHALVWGRSTLLSVRVGVADEIDR